MKNLLKGIFICIFAIFLMSHNVFATDVALNGDPVSHFATVGCFYSRWNNQGAFANGRIHTGGFNEISKITFYPCPSSDPINLDVGAYYMQVNINLGGTNAVPNPSLTYGGPNIAYYEDSYNHTSNSMPFLSSELVGSTTSGNMTYRDFRFIFKYAGGTAIHDPYYISIANDSGGMFATESYRITSVIFWKVNNSGASNQDIINSINNQSQALNNINNGIDDLKDTIQDRQDKEDEAIDNIENQSPSDISQDGQTENQATTNLIGLFQSFITALSGITQANNCNINLAFPSYAGGNITVNVCQNKDKGGNIVAVFSSLTLIIFYIPLALKLLSMIYNEIRSFTNG